MEPGKQPTFLNRPSIMWIVTLIIANRLAEHLNGYDSVQAKFLIQGFSEGFKIPFRDHRLFDFQKISYPLTITSTSFYLNFNSSSGRLMGPFKDPPSEK